MNKAKIKTDIVTTTPMFEIKENLEQQARNYLWGLDLTQKEAYEIITKKDEDYFDFVFKRMFENEYHGVVIKNIGVKALYFWCKFYYEIYINYSWILHQYLKLTTIL